VAKVKGDTHHNQVALRVIVGSSKIPPPYKALLVVHAYIVGRIARSRLCEFPLDELEIDDEDGLVVLDGMLVARYGTDFLLRYMEEWLADKDTEWLFPAPRNVGNHASVQMCSRYVGKIVRGELTADG